MRDLEHCAMLDRSFTGHTDWMEGLDLSGFSDFSFVLWNFRQLDMFVLASRAHVADFSCEGRSWWGERWACIPKKSRKDLRTAKVRIMAGYSPTNLTSYNKHNPKDHSSLIETSKYWSSVVLKIT